MACKSQHVDPYFTQLCTYRVQWTCKEYKSCELSEEACKETAFPRPLKIKTWIRKIVKRRKIVEDEWRGVRSGVGTQMLMMMIHGKTNMPTYTSMLENTHYQAHKIRLLHWTITWDLHLLVKTRYIGLLSTGINTYSNIMYRTLLRWPPT